MALKLEHVTKKFGSFTAVEDLTLSVNEGQMYGFLGANGAGKTTTFRMILGLLDPTEGDITWKGNRLTYHTSHSVGYLPEERGLYPKMKVEEQLIYLAKLRNMQKNDAKIAAARWMERFDVSHYASKKVEELSKGNQQKIQVISSLLHNPSLLILDEPFSGLDPVNVELLKEAIIDVAKEGATIVFSSHRMDHVEELCENLSIMHHGKTVVSGSLKEVKRGFGKQNVQLKMEQDLSSLLHTPGVLQFKPTKEGGIFQISDEKVGDDLLKKAIELGPVRHFSIEEPSLQEIFIEKVGKQHV
ncbi:ABC transporter ATP-binding protein [Paenisporosarcina cavernae]|uniref:ATP-binding cassette domain-containing protein n=1 Tax=Paenisporosarcina cavernae TaxID=2320858 RepID=A0A385YTL0_9BACL|nr:ABC transporter ATP-binding protein [Paenisporosarcina cavernae]AYC30179.1 ATP-binding cassette domain-containing protein [Paenisporosarcina cavernae]